MTQFRRYIPVIAVIAAVVVLQVVLSATHATYYMTQITMSAYYALVVIGLCLLMGYAGQVSLGHAGFFAIGGYTTAVLTTLNLLPYRDTPLVKLCSSLGLIFQRQDIYGADILSFSPWVAFVAALLLAVIIAFLIGLPVIRLKGHYLAMATLGFGLIIYRIVLGGSIFGQADGISNIPPFMILDGLQVNGRVPYRVMNYYIAWSVVAAAMVLAINLVGSRIGRALRSIHENEEAAHSLGVDTYRYKLFIFVLSALFAAVGGVLLTHYNGSIGPSEVTVMKSVRYLVIVAVGGMANLWGALFMGIILNFLSLRGVFGSYDDAVFAIILIVIMLFAPQGLLRMPRLPALWHGLQAREDTAKPVPSEVEGMAVPQKQSGGSNG
jgi:branched-chain amino acid transport system permease protein